jgi:methanogenic corrinoid protein MtbC1
VTVEVDDASVEEALGKLADSLAGGASSSQDIDPAHAELIALASAGDIIALTAGLERALARDGLRTFVLDTFAPLTQAVGELWAGGQLQIFEEHVLTRHLVHFLDAAMSRIGRPSGDPQVLLATLPGEQHALGLLMVEALLLRAGRPTLNLGADVPLDQIIAAVERSAVSTVALSFSARYARGAIRDDLLELAHRLPTGVTIWIGGVGVNRLKRLPPSVKRKSLESL